MQGCEEKEKVLLLWERALTLFYENDTELFVTGAQERTIAGKIAMHMDKIYREIFPMPELVIDIEYNRMDTDIKPKYPGSEDKKKRWTAPDIVLHEPFGFSLLLSFLAMFFYLYAYEPIHAGKGWKSAMVTWYQKFKESGFFRKLFFLAFVTSLVLFRTLLNRSQWMNPLADIMGGWGI